MSEQKLIFRREGQTGHIVFNNPAKLNAVSLDMWESMFEALTGFERDQGVRVVIVSGAGGKSFVSGADISKFESERANYEAAQKYNAVASRAYTALYEFPKPTIAKIMGYCIGGGVNLAACCDLRFASQGARFAVPAARLGLGYGYTPLRRLAEVIGLPRTLEMLYSARQFSAIEAYDMGLINKAVPDAELDGTVTTAADMICANAPLTIALAKASAREIGRPEAERDLKRLDKMVAACFDSEDYREGRRAFMEKREPSFKGA